MSVRGKAAGLLAMTLGAALISVLPSSPLAPAAAAEPTQPDSAVTVSGEGEFANLTVTVSQTKNLINQTVKVSWTGGTQTVDSLEFLINYLQIMQCWGDDPAGPDRTQCQYGGLTALGGNYPGPWVLSRQVTTTVVDPNETLKPAEGRSAAFVPFWAAGRPQPTGAGTANINEFFDSQVTNEIPLARTHGDGAGEEFFEVQTVRQAAGLGCGEPVPTGGVTKGRSCWLVIVPRSGTEVDGSTRDGTSGRSQLETSPLSQSNWDNRMMVPLEFQPVGQSCAIGAPERPLIGHELAVDAVSSWQPALCAGGGTLFSYTQLPDTVARSAVSDGRLALVTDPIPPDQVPADHPLVYAPVGLSGLAIVFNIDHQPPRSAPPAALALNGRRFTSMKLTPRLVAKLLTQSYRTSVEVLDEVNNSPEGLLSDPEFLDLNPEYKGFVGTSELAPDALVQLNGADVTSLLWSWVKADPDASAFLGGTADPFGMRINPKNRDLVLPTSTFPRNDQSCSDIVNNGQTLRTCNLDTHPYTKDMHDAGRSASRGDTQAQRPTENLGQVLPKRVERQRPGRRALLAVVDTATAARYGLPTAALRNAAGTFVAPTTESLLAGAAAMKPGAVAEVLASDPGIRDPVAYPLTALSYAVTAPSTVDAKAGKDYAAFLRHAGGAGQQPGIAPGDLPFGMVPLPALLRAQTIVAATTIETQTRGTPTSPPAPPTTTAPPRDQTGGSNPPAAASGTTTNSGGGRPASTPTGVTAPGGGPPAKAPSAAQQPVAGVQRTPSLPAPAVGALLVALLVVGAVAATSSPVTQLLGGGLRRRWRRGVTPTER